MVQKVYPEIISESVQIELASSIEAKKEIQNLDTKDINNRHPYSSNHPKFTKFFPHLVTFMRDHNVNTTNLMHVLCYFCH